MHAETLPAATQPDEPPNVAPCHTGAAARVCAFDVALLEQLLETAPPVMGTCISCGAEYGQPHHSWCKFTLLSGA